MDILSKFAETLASLMTEKGLNAPALAKILETDRSNVTRYLAGKRLPLFHGFVKTIEFFNVSADVLLGLKDYTEITKFSPVKTLGNGCVKLWQKPKQPNTPSINRKILAAPASIIG